MADSAARQKLESKLAELGVAIPANLHDNTLVLANPIEIYRFYLTEILAPLLPEVSPIIIYEAIQWTNSLMHGDLVREMSSYLALQDLSKLSGTMINHFEILETYL